MLFSILIANYNNGKYFRDCYNSIMVQTYHDWEVIIVDDKSTDDSLSLIKDLIENDRRFRLYVNDNNYGCGFTKRRCVELAIGDICGFVDPDDAITKKAIGLMVNEHIVHPDMSMVHSNFIYCDENLNEGTLYSLAKSVVVDEHFVNLDYAVNHFATFKKENYFKTEGIDSSLLRAVDQDLYLKLSETGSFSFLDIPLYKYRLHKGGIASNNGHKAFYCHLKVIANAEKRRKLNLEDDVEPFLNGESYTTYESYLNNPGYLYLKLMTLFKKNPGEFIRRILFRKKK